MSRDQSALYAAGPQAAEISRLWWVYLALLSAITVLVLACVAWAVLRGKKHHDRSELPALAQDDLPAQNAAPYRPLEHASERRKLRVVGASTIATGLMLIALLVESLHSSNVLAGLPGENALQIQVTGGQWWWEINIRTPIPRSRLRPRTRSTFP